MIFDQYSRYKACADLLRQVGLKEGNSILDVGSGPECLFGEFLPEVNFTFVDPLISSADSEKHSISGDIFSDKLNNRSFDCVSAVDVLEHVPSEFRISFINRFSSLSNKFLVLGFPTSDSSSAKLVDESVDKKYHEIYGHPYPWLEEHRIYSLPSLSETVDQLNNLGWNCQTIGHGYANWLNELLGLVICLWDIPKMRPLVNEISDEFNLNLYAHDFRAPHYRQFILASRSTLNPLFPPVSDIDEKKAEEIFHNILEKTREKYFSISIKSFFEYESILLKKDLMESDRQKKIHELSDWGVELQNKAFASNERISYLEKILTDKVDFYENLLTEKRNELNNITSSILTPFKLVVRNVLFFLRRQLAKTFIGDAYRYLKKYRTWKKKRISIDALRNSIQENNGKLIIVFPIITWDFRWQRPQHIVSRIRNHGYSIIYLAMSLSAKGKNFIDSREAISECHFNELERHINQIWLSTNKQLNIYSDSIEGDDLQNLFLSMSSLVEEIKPESIKYLIQFPGWWPIVKELKERFGGNVVFDCMDDHSGFNTNSIKALETEDNLLNDADLVIASSDLLYKKAKLRNLNVIEVKNGTEFEHFYNPIRNGELDHLSGRPIVGYYGAISDWFDMEILAYCARKKPDWEFVMIGATTGADLHYSMGLKNIHFLGEKPYKELPGYLAYFDICTIPFKIIPLTLATNPVKFYEYLSAGKPVVSVELPELLPYQEDCYLARDSAEFLFQLEVAFQERNDEEKINRRLKIAKENSWDSRVEKIIRSPNF